MKKALFFISICFIAIGVRASILGESDLHQRIKSIMMADEKREAEYRAVIDEESTEKEEFVCVSLGSNCFPALHLNNNNIRRWSFPFDWNVTSFYGLCSLIESNFEDLFNSEYLEVLPGYRAPGVYNNKCLTALAHDFPTIRKSDGKDYIVDNYEDYIDAIKTKYLRRISRFYNVCNLADTVYFFRIKYGYWKFDTTPNDKQSALKLRDLLRKTFPANNWVLVVVDESKEFAHDWGIAQIKNFQIDNLNSKDGWLRIYKKLNLIK